MIQAVFDTTILISAFVSRDGSAGLLVWQARSFPFQLLLSEELIEETRTSLLRRAHLRRRFEYSDELVAEYCDLLRSLAVIVMDWPLIQVVRDPNDNFVLATAIKGGADYLVSRDNDLLLSLIHI